MLEPDWVGRRVAVRRALADRPGAGTSPGLGRGPAPAGDLVGDLLELDDDTVRIGTATGPVTVPRASVSAARLVQPATRDILAFERVATRAWQPAQTADLHGWLLRADHGISPRVNSALVLRDPGPELEQALAEVRSWYAERGFAALLAVPRPARAPVDAALQRRGWTVRRQADVMIAPLDRVLAGPSGGLRRGSNDGRHGGGDGGRDGGRHGGGDASAVRVELHAQVDDRWLALFEHGAVSAEHAVRDLLNRHDRVRFAAAIVDGSVVAIARGVVDERWLGVASVAVRPTHRRRGLAGQLLVALAQWATGEHGATHGYLQVEAGNTGAIALYRRLGYWKHHDYVYLDPPLEPTDDSPT